MCNPVYALAALVGFGAGATMVPCGEKPRATPDPVVEYLSSVATVVELKNTTPAVVGEPRPVLYARRQGHEYLIAVTDAEGNVCTLILKK